MARTLALFIVALFSVLRSRIVRGPARPSWTFSFEAVVRFLRLDWDRTASWPLAELRAEHERRPYPVVRGVRTTDEVIGGVPVRRFVPPAVRSPGVVLYLHGGSYIYGSTRSTHGDVVARLALASGVEVIGVEYRLAPEHPFPAQRENALAVFRALVASGTPPERIVLAGDSAGGNLALVAQLALRDRGEPGAAGLVLISPWVDLSMPGASFERNERFDFGTREVLVHHAAAFTAGAALDDPQVSPTFADLHGLPRTLITIGTAELLQDDVMSFVEKLRAAGVAVTLHEAIDMPHNAPVFAGYHPTGQRALDRVVSFMNNALRDRVEVAVGARTRAPGASGAQASQEP